MRTKTLLLTAALTAAGAATSLAQAVYSQNIVGYINVTNYPGYNLIANQLNNGATTPNKVVDLMPTPPEGTFVFKFNPATGGYTTIDFADGAWEGDDLNLQAHPGEGIFVKNATANPFTVTFLGEVQLTSSVAIVSGYSIVSSVVPSAGPLSGAPPAGLNFPTAEGDFVYQFNRATGGYIVNDFADGAWEGDGGGTPPQIAVGEAFFVKAGAGHAAWAKTFTVGP
jgi:hypothetical protein